MSKKDIELDEKELRKYIDFVVKEVKKRGVDENPDQNVMIRFPIP